MKDPDFVGTGSETEKIDVRLSYRLVRLFSEGLYASPNKAIEELIANSFDAGALRVAVALPASLHDQGATIAVLDDGEGMDGNGLKLHWLIGKSFKRALAAPPLGRNQIGKFGIGKLATYVLANRLSHISKKEGRYYSTSMNYRDVDKRGDDDVEAKSPVKISLRELTQAEAQSAIAPWTSGLAIGETGIKLFGTGSSASWTLAILSDLKDKVHEIRPGVLEWVLRTALPLRDDFAIFLNGKKLESSKTAKGRLKRYVLGHDIASLAKPSQPVVAEEDKALPEDQRFALRHEALGRIFGYAETYKNLLTGKSDEIGRSHGFFVYVRGRLINVLDGHFGISPDELRHGTFGRTRIVVHVDGLDQFLQSDRERVREGPALSEAQNVLRAIFNKIRVDLDRADSGQAPGAKLAQNLASSPTSLARRPIIEIARAVLAGEFNSRYVRVPTSSAERDVLISTLEERAEKPESFVTGIELDYDATSDDGIAVYEASTGVVVVNGLHPFVGAFSDQLTNPASGLPLELFTMAEILLEGQLFTAGVKPDQVHSIMSGRDQLLRYFAQQSGRRTALMIATALRDARNDKAQLETEVVEAFRSLGFDAVKVTGKNNPDGVATAHLGAVDGQARRYAITLEAKSKETDGKALKTKTLGVSTVARHRDAFKCDHAVVVAPAFEHTEGKASALDSELKADRKNCKPRSIIAMHIDDLARLVELRPLKRLKLARMRDLFESCSLPEQAARWIDTVAKESVSVPPYRQILETIHQLQKEFPSQAVGYGEVRYALALAKPPIKLNTNEEVADLCRAMAALASHQISASESYVELSQSPTNVLAAIEAAVRSHGEIARRQKA